MEISSPIDREGMDIPSLVVREGMDLVNLGSNPITNKNRNIISWPQFGQFKDMIPTFHSKFNAHHENSLL